MEELSLELPHLTLAARAWGQGPTCVLALHGWMDNAGSYDRLAPRLPELRLVALDLPGHGRSQHRAPGAFYHFVDWIPDVIGALDRLGWDRLVLMGHSMGAGIAPLACAILGQRVEKLVMIEGLGPLTDPPEEAPERLSRSLACEPPRAPRLYPGLEAASERIASRGISPEGARCLAERGVRETPEGVVFRHDPRLRIPSRARLTEDQVLAFFDRVQCPALLLLGQQGLAFPELYHARLERLRNCRERTLPGGHHLHLDSPEPVADAIRAFLQE